MNKDLAIGETYVERLDRERQVQEYERSMVLIKEKNATNRSRHKFLTYVAGFTAAALVLCALAAVFFTDFGEDPQQMPDKSEEQVEAERESRCIDTGGGWVPKETFSGYPANGVCVYPGRKVETVE